MLRHRLTDKQWQLIADVFPSRNRRAAPRDRRQAVDRMLWILRTGEPWRDFPDVFGPWETVRDVFNTWNHDGTLQAIRNRLHGQVKIDDALWCIDGMIIRAAKCAASGGEKLFRRAARPRARPEPWRVDPQNPLVV